MKRCIKCHDPIHRTVLAEDEDEKCACCGDERDGLAEIKQEAYAEGWNDVADLKRQAYAEGWGDALEARDQEDAENAA
jgi:hypothetical protein